MNGVGTAGLETEDECQPQSEHKAERRTSRIQPWTAAPRKDARDKREKTLLSLAHGTKRPHKPKSQELHTEDLPSVSKLPNRPKRT